MLVKVQGPEQLVQQIYFEFDKDSMPLGQGGMGTVYLGRCVSELNGAYTPVAVKFIANNTDDLMKRAMQEASVQIAHPNLMRMWGFIPNMEWDPYSQSPIARYYVVMEYLEGVNLDSVLEGNIFSKAGLEIPSAKAFLENYQIDKVGTTCEIMRGVLTGVAEMHQHGFVHRDIDPSNAMLTVSGDVKVIDFGISKNLQAELEGRNKKLTSCGTIMGKMEYAAPEVVTGDTDRHNYSTDVYALGCMLYQLSLGAVPFTGSLEEIRYAQVNIDVPVENITHWGLAQVIKKATQKDQANRYQDAAEMLADFEVMKDLVENPNKGFRRKHSISQIEDTEEGNLRMPTWAWIVTPIVGIVIGVLIGIVLI